ncbi:MAG: peptide chain release factor N(5)-glutamine methyltransferase [Endomicrobium sp.]|nr:peptide chain release factor N(5)-glutamine methyltransferase [Endomicrobium sp.]
MKIYKFFIFNTMQNIYSLLKTAREILTNAGAPDAKACAEILLSLALNVKRSKLALIRDSIVSARETDIFNGYISRRLNREPCAYIAGSCEFMGYEFKVNKNVLIPRPETELLTEEVLKLKINARRPSALDLCSGSGCIAVSLSKLGDFEEITALDISAKALEIAKENARLNRAENINFIESDMFSGLGEKKFDIIVSNPPYVSEEEYEILEPELKFEPAEALKAPQDGLFFYKLTAQRARFHLNVPGFIFLELNANKSALIKNIFQENGFQNIEIIKDYAGLDRILKAQI